MKWCSKYIGIPFKDRGRAMSGCDCWGLACLVYANERGVVLPDFDSEYTNCRDIASIKKLHDCERPKWDEVEKPLPFDMVSLRIKGRPWHVGIVAAPGQMLHVEEGDLGVVIESYENINWRNRVDGFFRLKSEYA